jgi:hypothetical protein
MATPIEEVVMSICHRLGLSDIERGALRAMLSAGRQAARKLKRAWILPAADAGIRDETTAISLGIRRRPCSSGSPHWPRWCEVVEAKVA